MVLKAAGARKPGCPVHTVLPVLFLVEFDCFDLVSVVRFYEFKCVLNLLCGKNTSSFNMTHHFPLNIKHFTNLMFLVRFDFLLKWQNCTIKW